jgi:hypothetical protein
MAAGLRPPCGPRHLEHPVTDEQFLVLNSLYLRKIATAAVAGDCTGLPAPVIEATLSAAQQAGTAFDVGDGQFMLSEDGTQQLLSEYASRYARQRDEKFTEDWYQRFEVINGQFLTAISAWQHEQDDSKLDRLLRLVERHTRALTALSSHVDRYRIYQARFERALQQVDEGHPEYVVSPGVDSIHNIWFEFHEDILTLLGRPRDVAEAQG